MGTDGYQTYCGDHFITYAHVKSLHSIPETNITLHVTHTNTQTYNLTKKQNKTKSIGHHKNLNSVI